MFVHICSSVFKYSPALKPTGGHIATVSLAWLLFLPGGSSSSGFYWPRQSVVGGWGGGGSGGQQYEGHSVSGSAGWVIMSI